MYTSVFLQQADHAQLFDEGEKNEKARISELTSGRVTDLLPEVLNELNPNGFTTISSIESKLV